MFPPSGQNHFQEPNRSPFPPAASYSRTCQEPDPSPADTHTYRHRKIESKHGNANIQKGFKILNQVMIYLKSTNCLCKDVGGGVWGLSRSQPACTFAASMAFWGSSILGKAYMAPCTVLQDIPGTLLNISSVILALSARAASTAARSCCGAHRFQISTTNEQYRTPVHHRSVAYEESDLLIGRVGRLVRLRGVHHQV